MHCKEYPELLSKGGLISVPQARVAVLDGNAHGPGQAWKRNDQTIKTLWGELAWQLGQEEAFKLVADADHAGTSPGKTTLQTLLEKYTMRRLVDELVAYIRQFPADDKTLSGGTFGSNISFIQALTEACKMVPNAILLASLPESDLEAGGQRGVEALRSAQNHFCTHPSGVETCCHRRSFWNCAPKAVWPVQDEKPKYLFVVLFADCYIAEGARNAFGNSRGTLFRSPLASISYSSRRSLIDCSKIGPQLMDFSELRGVLKLMAKVIYRLWKDDNKDLMILPSSLPLYDGSSRNELICYLPAGWDAADWKKILMAIAQGYRIRK